MRSFRLAFLATNVAFAVLSGAAFAKDPPGAATATAAAPVPAAPTTAPSTAASPAPASAAPSAAPSAPSPSTAAPAAGPPAAPETPPSQYYVEPQAPGEMPPGGAPPPGSPETVFEPPPPPMLTVEPPPPIEPRLIAPRTAFWAGARVSWFVPFGSVWNDGFYDGTGLYYRKRAFSDYAASGPALELNLGARLSRRYNVFAIWEHAFLGPGNLDANSSERFGGQNWGESNFYGVGLRFSTEPNKVGFLLEIDVGYRDFHAHWADGTELALSDSWFDARVGFGADIRINPWFSLSPMLVLGGGSFNSGTWSGPVDSGPAWGAYDGTAEYGTLTLQLGGHVDIH